MVSHEILKLHSMTRISNTKCCMDCVCCRFFCRVWVGVGGGEGWAQASLDEWDFTCVLHVIRYKQIRDSK